MKNRLYSRQIIVSIIPASGEKKEISDLRVRFRIEKKEESKPNQLQLEVFNLSEASRSILEGKNTRVILQAGYDNEREILFSGNVIKISNKKDGPDIISKLEVADGANKFRNAKIEKAIPPGAKTKQVIETLAEALGLAKGAIIDIPDTQYINGISLSGLVKDRLDDVCLKNDLQWSIQDETLQIIPKTKTTIDGVVFVSPDTGMIGSPSKTKKGVEFKTLLQPILRPGRRVKIESRFINGIFKIRTVGHSGDSHQGDFTSECEAVIFSEQR